MLPPPRKVKPIFGRSLLPLISPRPFKSLFSLLPHRDPPPGGGCTEQLFPVAPEVAARVVVVGGKLNLNKADSHGLTRAAIGGPPRPSH